MGHYVQEAEKEAIVVQVRHMHIEGINLSLCNDKAPKGYTISCTVPKEEASRFLRRGKSTKRSFLHTGL